MLDSQDSSCQDWLLYPSWRVLLHEQLSIRLEPLLRSVICWRSTLTGVQSHQQTPSILVDAAHLVQAICEKTYEIFHATGEKIWDMRSSMRQAKRHMRSSMFPVTFNLVGRVYITKDGSLVINTLSSLNCFTCRNLFQNGANAYSNDVSEWLTC